MQKTYFKAPPNVAMNLLRHVVNSTTRIPNFGLTGGSTFSGSGFLTTCDNLRSSHLVG